jgi:hypothetical protein
MSPTLRDVNAEEAKQQDAEPGDVFDNIEKLRLSQDFQKTAGVKKLLTKVPVRKPHPQTYVRVHSDPTYRGAFAVIELKEDRETYLLTPEVAMSLPGEYMMVTLYTAITRQGDLFLWPNRLPGEDGRTMEWWRSGDEAATHAMKEWVRVKANMAMGYYDMWGPEGKIDDPVWPELTYKQILRIAFKGLTILPPGHLDHPVIKRLRGL